MYEFSRIAINVFDCVDGRREHGKKCAFPKKNILVWRLIGSERLLKFVVFSNKWNVDERPYLWSEAPSQGSAQSTTPHRLHTHSFTNRLSWKDKNKYQRRYSNILFFPPFCTLCGPMTALRAETAVRCQQDCSLMLNGQAKRFRWITWQPRLKKKSIPLA